MWSDAIIVLYIVTRSYHYHYLFLYVIYIYITSWMVLFNVRRDNIKKNRYSDIKEEIISAMF